jgi:uncharacterized phiE125 gp8 family phage protein
VKHQPDTFRVLEWPVVEPVSLSDVKHQIGLMADQTEHDRFLMDKVAAARRLIEKRLGMTFVATQYRATWKDAPEVLRLPAPPLLVASGYELTITADDVELEEADYELDLDAVPGEVTLSKGIGKKVVVEYWGGVEPDGQVCPMLRSAILAFVDHQFNNRGVLATDSAAELPQAFETLLAASSWNGGW